MKSIPIQGRRHPVLEDLGFLKKKNAYVVIAVQGMTPRTALKTPGNGIWQWAEDDPINSALPTPIPTEPRQQVSQE